MNFKQEYITRHRDIIPQEAMSTRITIVGAGAIGGFTALALAKMGYNQITVYDFDTVEPENIGNQFFDIPSIGMKKVDALKLMVQKFTGIEIHAVDKKITETDILEADIVISAVDSMQVRRMIFEKCAACYYLIDPRMGAEYATLSTLRLAKGTKEEREAYKKTLFSDSEAVAERCTAKTTMYTVLLIAGQVAKTVKDITTKQDYIRDMDWNIQKNAMVAFSNTGTKL